MTIALTAFAVAALAVAGAAFAGSSQGLAGKHGQTGTKVWYQSTGPGKDHPKCAAGNPGRFAIDISTPAGQSLDGKLGRAYALGKSVTFEGTGDCTVDPKIETLKSIEVEQ